MLWFAIISLIGQILPLAVAPSSCLKPTAPKQHQSPDHVEYRHCLKTCSFQVPANQCYRGNCHEGCDCDQQHWGSNGILYKNACMMQYVICQVPNLRYCYSVPRTVCQAFNPKKCPALNTTTTSTTTTTKKPTTLEPSITVKPTTIKPTTMGPTTSKPTTSNSTTSRPITSVTTTTTPTEEQTTSTTTTTTTTTTSHPTRINETPAPLRTPLPATIESSPTTPSPPGSITTGDPKRLSTENPSITSPKPDVNKRTTTSIFTSLPPDNPTVPSPWDVNDKNRSEEE